MWRKFYNSTGHITKKVCIRCLTMIRMYKLGMFFKMCTVKFKFISVEKANLFNSFFSFLFELFMHYLKQFIANFTTSRL